MMYKLAIGLLVIACILYYFVCFLEIFGVVKFTKPTTTMKFSKMIIPFYYLFSKD